MITTEMRYDLMRETIKYSDTYDDNFDLFNQGIQILEERIKTQNYEEFTVDELTILEEIIEKIMTSNNPRQRVIVKANTRWINKPKEE